MVRIRLKRTGTRNLSCFRVVVVDQRSTRDGRTIEQVGFYDPRNNEEKLDLDRYDHWVSQGAQPSQTVQDLSRRMKDPEAEAKRREETRKKAEHAAKEKEKAEKKAAAEAKAKADEVAKAKADEVAKAKADEVAKAKEAEVRESAEPPAATEVKPEEAPDKDKAGVTEEKGEEKAGE